MGGMATGGAVARCAEGRLHSNSPRIRDPQHGRSATRRNKVSNFLPEFAFGLRVRRTCLALQAKMAVELRHPRVPVAQSLPESLGLRDHDGDVRQLDLAAALFGLRGHELAGAGQHLLLHLNDLAVEMPPVTRRLE